jgi:hypothetical protein
MAAKRYKLPKFPPELIPAFESVCEALPADSIDDYHKEVDEVLAKCREVAKNNTTINIPLAEEIANRAHILLDHYKEFDEKKRALVVGAIRYFAVMDDALPADVFASGMNDDANVMNYVLEEVGLEEHCIKF